jgi:7-cyano-7-deazaguanine synthase
LSKNTKAVVLLSGGLDSTTVLALARQQGYEAYALTLRYGQRHEVEITAAQKIAKLMQVADHAVLDIDLSVFGGSALTSSTPIPKDRSDKEIGTGIPVTYVPARNTVFLSLALAWAEVLGAYDIFIGVNALDYSGYPDCRPDFIKSFEQLAALATKAGVEAEQKFTIHTPLIDLSKKEIIEKGRALGVDYSLTRTCYDPTPEGIPCGSCDACLLRLKGFQEAGLEDPLAYPGERL